MAEVSQYFYVCCTLGTKEEDSMSEAEKEIMTISADGSLVKSNSRDSFVVVVCHFVCSLLKLKVFCHVFIEQVLPCLQNRIKLHQNIKMFV